MVYNARPPVSAEEKQRRIDNNLCRYCGSDDHWVHDCPQAENGRWNREIKTKAEQDLDLRHTCSNRLASRPEWDAVRLILRINEDPAKDDIKVQLKIMRDLILLLATYMPHNSEIVNLARRSLTAPGKEQRYALLATAISMGMKKECNGAMDAIKPLWGGNWQIDVDELARRQG
ncbi:hypothetical protein K431DRAFT_346633 [Polychaeton citri CBS 116435]|uniref:CCHC-type domain-containing protein n=1 Tax=Polychaeton citri CBS 116435 TaxID=1314669 RepID=A0A9P4UQL1_9PEZI|nr:hypothetical protein K431DRAFT_346633 [Polychaeton citri CBS 116435]